MRLKFVEWLEQQEVNIAARELFLESEECYKAAAYRAALLFSFLGFQTILKHRILDSKPAQNYETGEWESIHKDITNDEIWEARIIKIVENKKKPIFNLSEDVHQQYFYWKNRRNDCAHAKGNIIDAPHVESFWLFIESNLAKFVVNGGQEHIIQQIKDHLNPDLTPLKADIDPIIKKIPSAIENSNYREFLEELLHITEELKKNFNTVSIMNKLLTIWTSLFGLNGERNGKLVNFLVNEERIEFTMDILREKPNLVKYFYKDEKFIRTLWHKHFYSYEDYYIFFAMIRNGLIPEDQIYEASIHMIKNVPSTVFWENQLSDIDKENLKQSNFFNTFYNEAFEEGKLQDFNWANRNRGLVIYYIRTFELDATIVGGLNSSLNGIYPPWHLRDDLLNFYTENMSYWDKHLSITSDIEDKLPGVLNRG